ncbi:carboxypeptidase-like regulatory domain-containing protein [Amycolatopsis sp. FDAARGOS 1241]|uniref:carboxypeptidase-like regulatory domain-containing protein n=1 Tax=Amycolatopsis sp. FDAARGOS 1241 TaxID=2778070 RepID=UPI001951980C|nr:carboxypeptidase-like regulatory domain-containing protein [Amycolatopsis sp. FDAARGOS 1241]QRP43294.1 carboxypeptidase regulatory-like domain-containing protein [Amycolatopsis sp. FDAARGOS 1241]
MATIARHRWWWQPLGISLLLVLVFIGLYVGFQRSPQPYQVPVAVAGGQLRDELAGAAGQAVDVVPVADRAAGDTLLHHGDAVAILTSQAGHLQLDVAGASGATTVSAAEKLVTAFAQHTGQHLVITDVLPLSAFDSKGMSGFYVAFGVTLASFALAQNLLAAARRIQLRHRMAALAGFAVLSGVVAATLAGPVFGALPAPFVPLALTLGLLSASTALATKALGTWFGALGIPLSTLLLITVGNSTSGGVLGVNLLPEPARWVSAVLPPGAAVRALADLAYFHGAHLLVPVLTLVAWSLGAALLIHVRERGRTPRTLPRPVGSLDGRVSTPAVVVVTDSLGAVAARAETDSHGRFHLTGLTPGEVTLTAVAEGFRPETRALTVAAGTTAAADLTLVAAPRPAEPAVVPAYSPTA